MRRHCGFDAARASLLSLLLATFTVAQQTIPVETGTGEISVARLLELASRQLHCSILSAPGSLMKLPPILVAEPIGTDLELELGRLLFTQKLTLMPLDAKLGLFEAVALDGQRRRAVFESAAWKTPEEIQRQPTSKQIVSTVVPVTHGNPRACAVAVQALQQPGESLSVDHGICAGDAGIVLRGLQDRVAAAITIVRQADQAAAVVSAAEQLEARLTELDQQVAELEKQITELQEKQPATAGK